MAWLGPQPAAAASALKMGYAAWTKGTNALVIAIRAMARAEGVEDALVDEWQRSQPAALDWSNRVPATAGKAWRWVAEMEEIAATLGAAGVPSEPSKPRPGSTSAWIATRTCVKPRLSTR